ncbi:MAG: signal peptidase I [Candidatus Eremiobacteraeota bacterium]|nr:signal peptidase I [Candidatus Eremiobacteraeota bacterium]
MSPYVLGAILGVLVLARVVIAVAPVAVSDDKQRGIIREYLDAFIIAGVVALVLMHFIVRTFWIPSASMEPTLKINDVLLANEIEYRLGAPQDGQVAVFAPPPQLGQTDFIKRVMAAPGDTLRIHNGIVYRNGKALSEPYLPAGQRPNYELAVKNYTIVVDNVPLDAQASVPPKGLWQSPDRVPNGYYIMLGDNRNDSDDSHLWGFLARDQFVGHAFMLFWPPQHARIIR